MPSNSNQYQVHAPEGFGSSPYASPWQFPTNYEGSPYGTTSQFLSVYGGNPFAGAWQSPSNYGGAFTTPSLQGSPYPSSWSAPSGYGGTSYSFNSPWDVPSGNVPSTWQGDMSTWGGGPSPWSDLGFGSFQDLIRYAQAQRAQAFNKKMSIQDIYEEKNRRLQTYLQEQREAEEMKRLMKQLEAQKYAQMLQFMQGMAGGGW